MSLESLSEDLRSKAALAPPLGYKVKFDLGDGGFIHWDGTGPTPEITNSDGPADTILTLDEAGLQGILDGTLDPQMAYMTGKLRVEGSLGVALKLADLLGD